MSYQSFINHLWFLVIVFLVFAIFGSLWLRYALDINKRNKRMNVQIQLLKAIAERLELSDAQMDEILNDLPNGEKEKLLAQETEDAKAPPDDLPPATTNQTPPDVV